MSSHRDRALSFLIIKVSNYLCSQILKATELGSEVTIVGTVADHAIEKQLCKERTEAPSAIAIGELCDLLYAHLQLSLAAAVQAYALNQLQRHLIYECQE